jgi:AraC-like DNA-binding protein
MAYFEGSIYILTAIIGFTTLFLLSFSYRSNKSVNIFLFLIVSIVCVRLIIKGTYVLGIQTIAKDIVEPFHPILLINAPLFYLYFRATVLDSMAFYWKNLLHFIIPILFVFSFMAIKFFHNTNLNLVVTFNYIGISLFMLWYLIKSFNLLRSKLWKSDLTIHHQHFKLMRNWTIFLFILATLLFFRNFVSFSLDFWNNKRITGQPFSIVQALIWLVIFGKILLSPEILFGLPKLLERMDTLKNEKVVQYDFWNYNTSIVGNQNDLKMKDKMDPKVQYLINQIELITSKKHIFRNQKTNFADVAIEIGVPVSHVVYMFKYHCKISFTEYKTIHKIEDAKDLIDHGYLKTNTLESLAFEIGFSSYSPFYSAFKKYMGLSPNEYVQNQFALNI